MEPVYVPTQRGPVLAGALFSASGDAQRPVRTVVIAITGIHGNFYSNPFYYNVGDALNAAGIDFGYAQTCDAFGQMRSVDVYTEEQVLIGTYDTFTYGDPAGFLTNINNHFPHPEHNKLVFIEGTGHTYQQKEQEMAEDVLELVQTWEAEDWKRGE